MEYPYFKREISVYRLFIGATIVFMLGLFQNSCQSANKQTNSSDKKKVEDDNSEEHPAETDRPRISMIGFSDNAKVEVLLDYVRETDSNYGPRIVELYMTYTNNMEYISSIEGDAIVKANKQLIIQNQKNKKQLRLVILASDNTNELDTGRLATLTFEKTDSEEATLRILTDKPIFAPTEANDGLLVSDPLTF